MTTQTTPVTMDASVVIKVFLTETQSGDAQVLLRHLIEGPRYELYTPDLLFLECSSVLWKCIRTGIITHEKADVILQNISNLELKVVPVRDHVPNVLSLAVKYDISVYDACYLQVVALKGGILVTADSRLIAKANREKVQAYSLSEACNTL